MKSLIFLSALIMSQQVLAAPFKTDGELGAYDLAAPIVQSRAALSNATAGQIVYDAGSSAFYGLPVGGVPTMASDWVQISPVSGAGSVTSSATAKINVAKFHCESSSPSVTQFGSWLSSTVTWNGGGQCSFTINSGVYGSTPYCVISGYGGAFSNGNVVGVELSSATAGSFDCEIAGSPCTSYDVTMMCFGAP